MNTQPTTPTIDDIRTLCLRAYKEHGERGGRARILVALRNVKRQWVAQGYSGKIVDEMISAVRSEA